MSNSLSAADLDLRLVRYFTVVAEHQRFVRAAEELHVTQPSLSRQIRLLERQLGARLLERTAAGSHLTEAGRTFLPRAKSLLHAAERAVTEVRAAARPHRISIGWTTDLFVTAAARHLRHEHPDCDIVVQHLNWQDAHRSLAEGRVDVLVTRMPLRADGLDVTVLHDEPRVLAVALDHRLAGKESITLDDIANEPMPCIADPAWDAYWRLDPRPDGHPAPEGPVVGTAEDKIELVASGEAVAIVPAAAPCISTRSDVTTIPLDGVQATQVVLAKRAGDGNKFIGAFCALARQHLTRPGSADGV